jgi:CRISPR/Cas system-associated exonuclease Cas4 (RecB family)
LRELLEEGSVIRMAESRDTYEIEGTPVYAIPDLVFQRLDGKWIVVDWKTGKKNESHLEQINIYCMYLKKKFNVSEKDIKGRVEYLIEGIYQDVDISSESVEATASKIKESIGKMKEVLLDQEKNIPQARSFYPLTSKRRLCPWCNFYEMCIEELNED